MTSHTLIRSLACALAMASFPAFAATTECVNNNFFIRAVVTGETPEDSTVEIQDNFLRAVASCKDSPRDFITMECEAPWSVPRDKPARFWIEGQPAVSSPGEITLGYVESGTFGETIALVCTKR